MNAGMVSTSLKPGQKLYMNQNDCLPFSRFLPKPKGTPAGIKKYMINYFLHGYSSFRFLMLL
jgi:hypothetical protein